MKISWVSACVVLLFGVASVSAQTSVLPAGDASGSDWPQWAGPFGNYTSPEKGLLREWPEGGPKVLWRAKIAQGWSAPSVAGNDIICAGSIGEANGDKETIVCLDAKTGKEKWNYTYEIGGYYYQWYVGWHWGGVRATPIITEKYIYSLGVVGKAICLDRNGKLVWEKDLGKEYWPYLASKLYHEWKGVNFSLIVAEGVVLIPFGFNGMNRCAGLDAETGKLKWVYPSDTDLKSIPSTTFTSAPADKTPVIATFGNDRCAVIAGDRIGVSNFDHAGLPSFRALRLSDGKPVWEFVWKGDMCYDSYCAIYLLGKQLIFSTALSTVSVDINFKTAPFPAKIASVANYRANYHGVVPSGDAFYGLSLNGDANNLPGWEGNLICLDRATGKVMWEQKGFRNGVSMIGADGLLFARSFQSLYLIEASTKGYVQKGVVKMHNGSNSGGNDNGWVMPVLSRGKLYVRCPGELICFDVSGRGGQRK